MGNGASSIVAASQKLPPRICAVHRSIIGMATPLDSGQQLATVVQGPLPWVDAAREDLPPIGPHADGVGADAELVLRVGGGQEVPRSKRWLPAGEDGVRNRVLPPLTCHDGQSTGPRWRTARAVPGSAA